MPHSTRFATLVFGPLYFAALVEASCEIMKSKSNKHLVQFGTRQIPYCLLRAKRKRLRIVVTPELRVDVFAPKDADDEQIRKAVKKKAPWIAKTLDKVERIVI